MREIQRKMHGFVYKNSNFWISKNETAAPSEEKVLLKELFREISRDLIKS